MVTKEMGRVQFIAQVEAPERWLTIFAFVTHKLWERACRKFGDVPTESSVMVFLHSRPETVMAKVRGLPPFVLIGLPDVTFMAVNEVEGDSSPERLLRAYRVIVAEELVHLRDLLAGDPIEDTLGEEGQPVKHYSRDCEYRALRFAVEATGQREDLLAKVEAARSMRE